MAEKKKKHPYTHTHITHHHDGSHTVKHHHEDGKSHKEHAVADHDSMMDSMMDHTSQPNPGEAEAESGQHGVPTAQAEPAGLPAPATPGVVSTGAGQ